MLVREGIGQKRLDTRAVRIENWQKEPTNLAGIEDAICYKTRVSVRRELSRQRSKPGKLVVVILGAIVFASFFAWSCKMFVTASLTLCPARAVVEKAAVRCVVWRTQASIGSIGRNEENATGSQMAGCDLIGPVTGPGRPCDVSQVTTGGGFHIGWRWTTVRPSRTTARQGHWSMQMAGWHWRRQVDCRPRPLTAVMVARA